MLQVCPGNSRVDLKVEYSVTFSLLVKESVSCESIHKSVIIPQAQAWEQLPFPTLTLSSTSWQPWISARSVPISTTPNTETQRPSQADHHSSLYHSLFFFSDRGLVWSWSPLRKGRSIWLRLQHRTWFQLRRPLKLGSTTSRRLSSSQTPS